MVKGYWQEILKEGHTFLSHLALAFAQCTQAMGIRSIEASIVEQKAEQQSYESGRVKVSNTVVYLGV